MNRCSRKLKELLPWYANNTLSDPERQRLAAHLKMCAACRHELSELRTLKAMVTETVASIELPSSGLFEKTVEQIGRGERHTIAQVHWQLFACGFTLGVLYERGRVKIEPEIETLGWKLMRKE